MKLLLTSVATVSLILCQTKSGALVVNPAEAKWEHGPRDPAGADSVMVREDAKTGGMELLVHYSGGHVFTPHWHESNERIVMLEGRLSLREGTGDGASDKFLEAGGYAFLPGRKLQTMVCVSKTRCSFYVGWDGNSKSHPGPAPEL